ncbi:hypothetical protein ACFQL7_27620 [Halocatena marina]|uniref:Uncharacterized protein n=1 Tax=Halocatena marina TaxID=2934937 RepID=A0ABD5YXY5_9EURY
MATDSQRTHNWRRFIGCLSVAYGFYILLEGAIIPGGFFLLGGAAMLPIVNRYIVYVPVPVGMALSALGWLMIGGQA